MFFLVISGHLRSLNHCPKWEIPQVCPICGNLLIETTSNPFWQEIRSWGLGSFFWDHRDERDHSETEYHQNDNKFLCYLCRPYCLCCLFSQKRRSLLTITNYSLLITNCIFAPSDKKLGRAAWGVFFETTETTAKQSIIRMIINFSVISVVPTVSVVSFLKKGAAF